MPETKNPIHPAYLTAVQFLQKNPHTIERAWQRPWQHEGGILFQHVSPGMYQDSATYVDEEEGLMCGCLTQIAANYSYHPTVAASSLGVVDQELTDMIRADHRIPHDANRITPDDLMVFAEWQQFIDERYGRTPRSKSNYA